jgi:hypothetical protein
MNHAIVCDRTCVYDCAAHVGARYIAIIRDICYPCIAHIFIATCHFIRTHAYRSRIMYVYHAYIVYTRMHIQGVCTYYVRVSLVYLLSPVTHFPCPSSCCAYRRCSDLSRFVHMALGYTYHMHMGRLCMGVRLSCDSLFTYRHALCLHTVTECVYRLATASYVHSQLMYACISMYVPLYVYMHSSIICVCVQCHIHYILYI